MTPKLRIIVRWTILIVLPIAYWVGSEVYYARSIRPTGVRDVAGYFQRFGEPRSVRLVERDGQSYYEFTGRGPWPSMLVLVVLPSSLPAYVFDEQGKFVEWSSDPGDQPSYRSRWPLAGADGVDVTVVKEKFGV